MIVNACLRHARGAGSDIVDVVTNGIGTPDPN